MESRKLLPNGSYFAFTATPKNKTLEIFGEPDRQPDGTVRHHAFHSYTMKQAIQERFILDVLAHYTPVASYYRLAKTVEDDPEFDVRKAQKKLRRFVEGHDHAIRLKAEIMVDHFHEQVLARNKIGGQARAMVVTNGIERAIQYFHAIRDYLEQRKSPYRAVVAFSGEPEYGGRRVTEGSLNGFPSSQIARKIREDPYRFLVCADKFQTTGSRSGRCSRSCCPDILEDRLTMFVSENRIDRELYWAGLGFQIWCQLLTHISRCSESDLLVVDEPEVYLHPEVQRQLLGILREVHPDIVLATHSVEILGEADPSEILLVDKSRQSARRLRDVEGVQQALDNIGSVQNLTLTELARNRRMLFLEGLRDYKIVRRFAGILGLSGLRLAAELRYLSREASIPGRGFRHWLGGSGTLSRPN
jgi:hypothetical protein